MEILSGYSHKVTVNMGRFTREPTRLPCRTEQFIAQVFDADLKTQREVVGSADFCLKLLSQRLYINQCGCYSPFLPYPVMDQDHPLYQEPVLCFNMSHFNSSGIDRNARCMYDVYSQFREDSVYMNLPEAAYCETFRAMPPCESINYVLESPRRTPIIEFWADTVNEARGAFVTSTFESVFGEDLPAERLSQMINNTGNTSSLLFYMRNNFGLVKITRKLPRGTLTHEELEYPLSELLSDVGGLMGLWIGISVIGLFEVVELFAFVGLTMISALLERCFSFPSSPDASSSSTSSNARINATNRMQNTRTMGLTTTTSYSEPMIDPDRKSFMYSNTDPLAQNTISPKILLNKERSGVAYVYRCSVPNSHSNPLRRKSSIQCPRNSPGSPNRISGGSRSRESTSRQIARPCPRPNKTSGIYRTGRRLSTAQNGFDSPIPESQNKTTINTKSYHGVSDRISRAKKLRRSHSFE